MNVCSQARLRMSCSGVRATLLERRRHQALYFIYDYVCFRAKLREPCLNRMGLMCTGL